MTTKNSCARNLSRLLSGVAFISSLLQRLAADPAVSLRCAAAQEMSFIGQGKQAGAWKICVLERMLVACC